MKLPGLDRLLLLVVLLSVVRPAGRSQPRAHHRSTGLGFVHDRTADRGIPAGREYQGMMRLVDLNRSSGECQPSSCNARIKVGRAHPLMTLIWELVKAFFRTTRRLTRRIAASDLAASSNRFCARLIARSRYSAFRGSVGARWTDSVRDGRLATTHRPSRNQTG